jgi:hypothetical protein
MSPHLCFVGVFLIFVVCVLLLATFLIQIFIFSDEDIHVVLYSPACYSTQLSTEGAMTPKLLHRAICTRRR